MGNLLISDATGLQAIASASPLITYRETHLYHKRALKIHLMTIGIYYALDGQYFKKKAVKVSKFHTENKRTFLSTL